MRQYVLGREFTNKKGKRVVKKPKIQRLVTPTVLQRKRRILSHKVMIRHIQPRAPPLTHESDHCFLRRSRPSRHPARQPRSTLASSPSAPRSAASLSAHDLAAVAAAAVRAPARKALG